jgi:hypothetical protein
MKIGAIFLFFILFLGSAAAAEPVYIFNGQIATTYETGGDLKVLEDFNASYDRYSDYANGYSLPVPKGMAVDVSLAPLVTVFTNGTTTIEVYRDNFSHTSSNAVEYLNYSSNYLRQSKYHTISANRMYYNGSHSVKLLKWQRPKLARVANDKNHYANLAFLIDRNTVYTVSIKSTEPVLLEQDIIAGFKKIPIQGEPKFYKNFRQSSTRLNTATKEFFAAYFSPSSPLRWGIFEMSAPSEFEKLEKLEQELGYVFPVLVHYQKLDDYFPIRPLEAAAAKERYLEVTFQTYLSADPKNNQDIIYAILDGKYDSYLEEYAAWLKRFNKPLLFRLNNEMNGDWCYYNACYYGQDADLYKALWRYIHTIFTQAGVENVLWVFNPHDLSFPPFAWNHYLNYYPGDEYVDIIGLTGYNTGTYYRGEKWREFTAIYPALYADYDQHFAKPFMISEFGSNSIGGDKAAWLTRMFNEINQFPKIKLAIWWNGVDYNTNGQSARIYRLDETAETKAVFRQGLAKFEQ